MLLLLLLFQDPDFWPQYNLQYWMASKNSSNLKTDPKERDYFCGVFFQKTPSCWPTKNVLHVNIYEKFMHDLINDLFSGCCHLICCRLCQTRQFFEFFLCCVFHMIRQHLNGWNHLLRRCHLQFLTKMSQ